MRYLLYIIPAIVCAFFVATMTLAQGTGTINQLDQWRRAITGQITQNVPNTLLRLTGYESPGFCLVTDSFGNVSTSSCGGGGSSKWTDNGNTITPTTGESIVVNGTSTLQNLVTNTIQASTSGGILFRANSNTAVADFGAGGGSNASFFGGVNIDGQTRLATSLTGLLTAASGVVTSTTTSAGLAAILSDETGTGSAVFSANPTFTGTATFSNLFSPLATITSATSTNIATNRLNIGGDSLTELVGAGLQVTGGNTLALNATGDWTGTFDGQEGTWYRDRANHTGTQLASTISDLTATIQALSVGTTTAGTVGNLAFWTGARTLGNVATGTLSTGSSLTVTAGRGVLGGAATIDVASGFTIPTTTGLQNLYANSHSPVTLSGTPNYITLVGQDIVRGLVNLASHVTGILGIGNGGTGISTTPLQDRILVGNGTGYDLRQLVGGANVTLSTSTPGQFIISATGGGGAGSIGTSSPLVAGQVMFATGASTTASRATTTLVAGTGITFSGGTPIIIGSSPITIEATGGGGGGGGSLSTTTDIIGLGGAQLASFVNSDFLIGGGSSTTAEFQFDDDGAQLIIASSSNTASSTWFSANNNPTLSMGVGSTSGGISRGVFWSFSSSTRAVLGGFGGVVDLTFDSNVFLASGLKDVTGSLGVSGMVLTSTGTSTRWVATSSLGISGGGGGGSGTVNSGNTGQFAWYSATGTAVSGTSTLAMRLVGTIWQFIVDAVVTFFTGNVRIAGNLSVGTTTYYGIELIDDLYVDGYANTGEWMLQECTAIGFTGSAQLAGDTVRACDNFAFIEDANAVLDYDFTNSNYPPNLRIRAGTSGATNVAGDGGGINTVGGFLSDHLWAMKPVFESNMNLRVVQNATGTVLTNGIANRTGVSPDLATEPTIGFYFFATSTNPNWLAVCNPQTGATTYIDTGVPTSTVSTGDELAFRHYRIDTDGTSPTSASAVFRIRTNAGGWQGTNGVVASCSGINMDSPTEQLGAIVGIGRVLAGGAQPELGVSKVRYGYRIFLD